ncbi:MAG TPA: DUF5709 domain-containing protein [Streptosporangiaceae bacterium]|jgi:hypothetical protein|nr:DUF5709 domain-containing protein [Streptosporangiaceae bacterium]
MPDETRHESADLEDYQVMDSSDTLDDAPGDDPLDRGVIPPERWSAGMRFGTTESEQADGESLDQLLAEEEPEPGLDEEPDDESLGRAADDDDALADEDVDGLLLDDGPDPRAGRLVSVDDEDDLFPASDGDLIGTDAGIDGGAATAEEAAVHVVEEDDYDIRSE